MPLRGALDVNRRKLFPTRSLAPHSPRHFSALSANSVPSPPRRSHSCCVRYQALCDDIRLHRLVRILVMTERHPMSRSLTQSGFPSIAGTKACTVRRGSHPRTLVVESLAAANPLTSTVYTVDATTDAGAGAGNTGDLLVLRDTGQRRSQPRWHRDRVSIRPFQRVGPPPDDHPFEYARLERQGGPGSDRRTRRRASSRSAAAMPWACFRSRPASRPPAA